MTKQWKTIGLIAAVLAIGSFSGAYAQRGGGGGGGHGGGGGGHGGGGGGGGHGGGGGGFGGGGGHAGGGGGNFGGGHVGGGGGNFGGGNLGGGGGVRVGGGGVNIGSGGGVRVGGASGINLGGSTAGRVGGTVGNNLGNFGRVGVGGNNNAGVQFHNLNSAINQAGRIGAGTNAGLNNSFNNRIGVGAGLNNGYNNGRYSAGYRGNNNSFFFGTGSPYNNYYGSSYYRNGYGYRGPIYGYGGYGGYNGGLLGIGLGYGLGYGLGGGYGYGGYGGGYGGYGYSPSFGYQSVATYQPVYVAAPADQAQPPAADPTVAQTAGNSNDFALSGEQNFKAGKYNEAIRDWQHALVDEPRNGAYIMLLSQAFFATGKFNEAAGAVQAGTQLLPDKDWGLVITHYKELYANQGDYTNQLRALEKARNDKQDDPALRFLLGWHYNYLGFAPQGLREIDKAIELAPKDEITVKVRDVFAKTPPAPQAAAR